MASVERGVGLAQLQAPLRAHRRELLADTASTRIPRRLTNRIRPKIGLTHDALAGSVRPLSVVSCGTC